MCSMATWEKLVCALDSKKKEEKCSLDASLLQMQNNVALTVYAFFCFCLFAVTGLTCIASLAVVSFTRWCHSIGGVESIA
jgi:hypothetical protein